MSDNASSKLSPAIGILDVILFLALTFGIDHVAGYFFDEQSLMGGLIGVTASVLIAWGLLLLRGQRWRDVGLKRPSSFIMMIVWALIVSAGIYFTQQYVGPLLGEEPNLERFAPLQGNLPMYLQIMGAVWVTAALFEELVYRGFMLTRLEAVFGSTVIGMFLAVLAQAVVFGLIHYYQGWAGMVLTGIGGFIFGLGYYLSGRNLWALILAHGLVNTYGLTMIFLYGVESLR